jgi:hypothetical protein
VFRRGVSTLIGTGVTIQATEIASMDECSWGRLMMPIHTFRAAFRDNGLPIRAPRSPTARARKDLYPPRRRTIKLRHVFML